MPRRTAVAPLARETLGGPGHVPGNEEHDARLVRVRVRVRVRVSVRVRVRVRRKRMKSKGLISWLCTNLYE